MHESSHPRQQPASATGVFAKISEDVALVIYMEDLPQPTKLSRAETSLCLQEETIDGDVERQTKKKAATRLSTSTEGDFTSYMDNISRYRQCDLFLPWDFYKGFFDVPDLQPVRLARLSRRNGPTIKEILFRAGWSYQTSLATRRKEPRVTVVRFHNFHNPTVDEQSIQNWPSDHRWLSTQKWHGSGIQERRGIG